MQIIHNNTNITNLHTIEQEKRTVNTGSSFSQIFENTIEKRELTFSKHAEMRLKTRDIDLSEEQLDRINQGLSKARNKGIKDSLILVDNVALLVNIKNKTVITAMEQQEEQDKVFTNIDGAVIV